MYSIHKTAVAALSVSQELPNWPGCPLAGSYKPKGLMAFIRTPKEGKAIVSEGKYKMREGEKIEWTVNEFGNERGETTKIKTLTENKLIVEDPDGIKEEFMKVVEKDPKKEDKKKDKKKDQ